MTRLPIQLDSRTAIALGVFGGVLHLGDTAVRLGSSGPLAPEVSVVLFAYQAITPLIVLGGLAAHWAGWIRRPLVGGGMVAIGLILLLSAILDPFVFPMRPGLSYVPSLAAAILVLVSGLSLSRAAN